MDVTPSAPSAPIEGSARVELPSAEPVPRSYGCLSISYQDQHTLVPLSQKYGTVTFPEKWSTRPEGSFSWSMRGSTNASQGGEEECLCVFHVLEHNTAEALEAARKLYLERLEEVDRSVCKAQNLLKGSLEALEEKKTRAQRMLTALEHIDEMHEMQSQSQVQFQVAQSGFSLTLTPRKMEYYDEQGMLFNWIPTAPARPFENNVSQTAPVFTRWLRLNNPEVTHREYFLGATTSEEVEPGASTSEGTGAEESAEAKTEEKKADNPEATPEPRNTFYVGDHKRKHAKVEIMNKASTHFQIGFLHPRYLDEKDNVETAIVFDSKTGAMQVINDVHLRTEVGEAKEPGPRPTYSLHCENDVYSVLVDGQLSASVELSSNNSWSNQFVPFMVSLDPDLKFA